MTKKRIAIILGSVLGVAAAALVLVGVLPDGDTARAQTTQITTVAIDMEPYTDVANDEDTVGTIQKCVRVSGVAGTTFDVDLSLIHI